jgi:SPP1 family predicted phage head-tail adaptor
MRAGLLDRRLTFQSPPSPTNDLKRDALGQPVLEWTTVCTVWGSIEPLRGREYMESKALEADITARIRIRYRDGIVPTMRIVADDGLIYKIESVVHLKTGHRELQLMVVEQL